MEAAVKAGSKIWKGNMQERTAGRGNSMYMSKRVQTSPIHWSLRALGSLDGWR